MPITIQEIIASDTISQLVDKTNFNFDQLLLNGGGPAGPLGPAGPTGPNGGRGPKGSTWYEDTATVSPGTNPNTIIVSPNLLTGDYYLDFDGWVWEYTTVGITTSWVKSTINLTGPTGSTGMSGSFGLSFGSPLLGYMNTLYCAPIGTLSPTTGATSANEGVPSIMMGGVVTNTATTTGVPLTAAYQIPDVIAQSITSNVASVLIHQRNAGGRSIVFHGGNAPADAGIDKFEQVTFGNLSNISIGVNDRLQLNVPKTAIGSMVSMNDLVGIEVNSESRSHSYRAGQQIKFVTGIDSNNYGIAGENSNFEIQLQQGSNTAGNKFQVETQGSLGTLTEIGNVASMITAQAALSQFEGRVQYQASDIRFITAPLTGSGFSVYAASAGSGGGGNITLNTIANTGNAAGSIFLTSGAGGIAASTTSGDIDLTSTTGDINLINNKNINIIAGGAAATYPGINLVKTASPSLDQIILRSNVGTSLYMTDDISLTTTVASTAISISASGVSNLLLLGTNETSGKISIGAGGTNTKPQINVDYSGTNKVTNIKGAIQYTKTGTWNNANAALQSIFVDNQGYASGDTIMRIGNQTTAGTSGVGSLAIADGTNSSIWMGKSATGGTFHGLGLYVNSTAVFAQATTISPSTEKFRATEDITKISNRMLWGGKNGTQEYFWDPMYNYTAAPTTTTVSVDTPYIKITAITNDTSELWPGPYTYAKWSSTTPPPFGNNINWVKTYRLDTGSDWVAGQRVHIEVTNVPSEYSLDTGQICFQINQYGGLIKLQIPTFKKTNGTWTYQTIDCGGPTTGGTSGTSAQIPTTGGLPLITSWTQTFQWGGLSQTATTGGTACGTETSYSYTKGWTPIGNPVANSFQM